MHFTMLAFVTLADKQPFWCEVAKLRLKLSLSWHWTELGNISPLPSGQESTKKFQLWWLGCVICKHFQFSSYKDITSVYFLISFMYV